MSTLALARSEMVMPSRYVEIDRNEMIYIEGGKVNLNKFTTTWYGFDVYLNSTNANKVVAGAGLAAIGTLFIPDPTITKALAAVLGTLAGFTAWANAAGKGVCYKFLCTRIPTVGLPIISTLGVYAQK
jgi:hypothetical protein